MMRLERCTSWTFVLVAGLLVSFSFVPTAEAVDDSRYLRVNISGRLTDPETEEPMVGAAIHFVSIEEEGDKHLAITDHSGNFEVGNLGFSSYAMTIETAEGERIWGVNALDVAEDEPIVIVLKISDRIESTTEIGNLPGRFFAVVRKEDINWRRFWQEFAAFFGAAAGLGAAAL